SPWWRSSALAPSATAWPYTSSTEAMAKRSEDALRWSLGASWSATKRMAPRPSRPPVGARRNTTSPPPGPGIVHSPPAPARPPPRPGLPEQRARAGGGHGRRAGDGAAVAAQDQVDPPVGQRPDGRGGGVGLGHVDLVEHAPAARAAT